MGFVVGRLCSSFEKGRDKPNKRQRDLDRKSQCKRLQKRYASNVKKALVPLVPDLEFPSDSRRDKAIARRPVMMQ